MKNICRYILIGLLVVNALRDSVLASDSALTQTLPYEQMRQRLQLPAVGAHQGQLFGWGWMNSIAAFEEAYRNGVDIIELDLRLTKDGIPIVYHDETLDLWTPCHGHVRDYTAFEIQKNCHFLFSNPRFLGNTYPPLFSEVLDWNKGKVILNAEFKDVDVIEPAVQLVQYKNAYSWIYFQTKGAGQRYERARALDPKLVLLYNVASVADLDWALSVDDPAMLVIELHDYSRSLEGLSRIHRRGKLASENSWHFTMDYEFLGAACDTLYASGIDIAITNRPRQCLKQRNTARTEKAKSQPLE